MFKTYQWIILIVELIVIVSIFLLYAFYPQPECDLVKLCDTVTLCGDEYCKDTCMETSIRNTSRSTITESNSACDGCGEEINYCSQVDCRDIIPLCNNCYETYENVLDKPVEFTGKRLYINGSTDEYLVAYYRYDELGHVISHMGTNKLKYSGYQYAVDTFVYNKSNRWLRSSQHTNICLSFELQNFSSWNEKGYLVDGGYLFMRDCGGQAQNYRWIYDGYNFYYADPAISGNSYIEDQSQWGFFTKDYVLMLTPTGRLIDYTHYEKEDTFNDFYLQLTPVPKHMINKYYIQPPLIVK